MRDTCEIIIRGKSLAERLEMHAMWLRGEGGGRLDVSGEDMADANMAGANMAGANMVRAYMAGANMAGANMARANMAGAYMAGAYMADANMAGANMAGANMVRAYMARANMADANMARANMAGANMVRAYMAGVAGNMREIRSMHVDTWPVAWITAPDGEVTVQIGCQRHPLGLWEKSDPRWIAALDRNAPEWWSKHRDLVLGMIRACPATPYGKAPE